MPMAGLRGVAQDAFVPGEPGSGPSPLLHPIQFNVNNMGGQQQPQSRLSRIQGLAAQARGTSKSSSDTAHQARDLLFSGSYSPQHQLRGLTNTRGAFD